MANRSKLLALRIANVGCIGPDGVEIALDDVVCLVGRNNVGKSTILRAYELAKGSEAFDPKRDKCRWCLEDEPSSIELDVHIPEGIANIDPKWKQPLGDQLVVRSRWQWSAENDFQRIRTTWDPEAGEWAEDGKAGGADNVFNSRLPIPLRINSLEDADHTQSLLLLLALEPFLTEMKEHDANEASPLSEAVNALVSHVSELAQAHQERFDHISAGVQKGFSGVFPDVGLRLNIEMMEPPLDWKKLLGGGSGLIVSEGKVETTLEQQGTGARRALFWSMLQVHNAIKRDQELKEQSRKPLVQQLQKERKKAAPDEDKIAEIEAAISDIDSGNLPASEDDPALPGYLLLIDEPENALHPIAARAAQRHLYQLGNDPEWQVVMTTHSPYFVNPLEDHTTIVRLDRHGGDDGPLLRKTYRSDAVEFDGDEKQKLHALQQMDPSFSEIFFGSYPVLVEGDTEHAAFLAAVVEQGDELVNVATPIRARGKAILPALIRMLDHFQVDFGILHDVDWPYTQALKNNGMWTVNQTILDALGTARSNGRMVRHRISVPDFERFLGGDELGRDKPLSAYMRIKEDSDTRGRVLELLNELCSSEDQQPPGFDPDQGEYLSFVGDQLHAWAEATGNAEDPRLGDK